MKKALLTTLLILILESTLSIAADHSGCLTCHRYPGLAVMTEKGILKITNIDENKFLRSPHKDLGCQDCHTGISSMPPSEKPKIDCRSTCHESNEEKRKVKNFPLHKMHEGEQSAVLSLDDKSPCRICHNSYPHSKYKPTRTILNKHTFQLVCEVCHLIRDGGKEVIYDWAEPENVLFKGEPFGSYYKSSAKVLLKPESALTRIGIYLIKDGKKEPLMKKWDKETAKKLKVPEKNWNTDQSIKVMNYLHKGIGKMVARRACDKCHKKGGFIDFRALGFSEKRAHEIETMDLKRVIAGYETFHIPTFMKPQ